MALAARAVGRVHVYDVEQRLRLVEIERVEASGKPPVSFAADAHDCIMVRVLGPTGYKVVARLNRAR